MFIRSFSHKLIFKNNKNFSYSFFNFFFILFEQNKKKDKKCHKKSCDSHDSNKKGGDSGKGGDASKPGEKPECK